MALIDENVLDRIVRSESLPIHELIAADARELSAKLVAHRLKLFPPRAVKTLRKFSSGEAAKLIGVNDTYLRQLSLEGWGPQPEIGPAGAFIRSNKSMLFARSGGQRATLVGSSRTGRRDQIYFRI